MKIYLDANILVSVLNKEYPLFPFTARIVGVAGQGNFEVTTSPLCLAIAFYFAEKKHGTAMAKKKTDLLCQHIKMAENKADAVRKTLSNPSIYDFEDGLEYYAATDFGCRCIVTENKEDFYFSEIEVLGSIEFCSQYLF